MSLFQTELGVCKAAQHRNMWKALSVVKKEPLKELAVKYLRIFIITAGTTDKDDYQRSVAERS